MYNYVWVGNISLLCVRVCLWGHLLRRHIDGHAGPKGHTRGRRMNVCVGQTSNPFLLMNKMWCRVNNERGGPRSDTCCTLGSVSDAVDKLFMAEAHAKRRCVMWAVLGPTGDHITYARTLTQISPSDVGRIMLLCHRPLQSIIARVYYVLFVIHGLQCP